MLKTFNHYQVESEKIESLKQDIFKPLSIFLYGAKLNCSYSEFWRWLRISGSKNSDLVVKAPSCIRLDIRLENSKNCEIIIPVV